MATMPHAADAADAVYQSGDLDADALREIVLMVSHYAGWPVGARLNSLVEETIAKGRGDE